MSKDLFGILYLIESGILYLIESFGTLENRIRFQKLALISKIGYNYPFSFKFERYKFGPYSFELQGFLNFLISDGLIIESEHKFKLTDLGRKILNKMKTQASDEMKNSLDSVFKIHEKSSVSDSMSGIPEEFS